MSQIRITNSPRSSYLVTKHLPRSLRGLALFLQSHGKHDVLEDLSYELMKSTLKQCSRNRNKKSTTMIEYALLVALIAIIALAAIRYLGNNVRSSSLTFATILKS